MGGKFPVVKGVEVCKRANNEESEKVHVKQIPHSICFWTVMTSARSKSQHPQDAIKQNTNLTTIMQFIVHIFYTALRSKTKKAQLPSSAITFYRFLKQMEMPSIL